MPLVGTPARRSNRVYMIGFGLFGGGVPVSSSLNGFKPRDRLRQAPPLSRRGQMAGVGFLWVPSNAAAYAS